jgi:hypothetical protein
MKPSEIRQLALELSPREEVELRDKFAMAAITGLLADCERFGDYWDDLVKDAYRIADDMLKQRKL